MTRKIVMMMVSMALVLKDIPTENITFVQYPATTGLGGVYAGKAAPVERLADALFEKIRNDESFLLEEDATGNGSTLAEPAPSPSAPAPEPSPTETATAAPAPSASPTVPPVPGEEPAAWAWP